MKHQAAVVALLIKTLKINRSVALESLCVDERFLPVYFGNRQSRFRTPKSFVNVRVTTKITT